MPLGIIKFNAMTNAYVNNICTYVMCMFVRCVLANCNLSSSHYNTEIHTHAADITVHCTKEESKFEVNWSHTHTHHKFLHTEVSIGL